MPNMLEFLVSQMRWLLVCLFMSSTISGWSLDYYWVGGSGNWSELRHWATTSGGNVAHDQIPTAEDHVIFDVQSFPTDNGTVNLDLDNIFCNNLDFSAIDFDLTIRGSNLTTLNIFGSLYMHENVILDFAGPFDFRSDQDGNEIDFKGQRPFELTFSGDGGWRVVNDIQIDSLLHMTAGQLIFDSVSVGCHRFEVYSNNGATIDFGGVGLMIRGNRHLLLPAYDWREALHFEGPITTSAGQSLIHLGGRRASIGFYEVNEINLGQVTLGRPGGKHQIFADQGGQYQFQKLHLRGDTRLEGGFAMQELELDGSNIYTLQSGSDQRVGRLTTNTDCEMVALLRSSEGGLPASIVATAGAQQISHSMIKDIHVQSASYEVLDAVDLGGNQGWALQERSAATFYWVGGSGNWNDTDHWSFSSGGPPSGCLPTAVDDVIFDGMSFNAVGQIVTINVPSAFCHTMDWRGISQAARLEQLAGQSDLSLHVYGSLYFSLLTENAFDGDVHFESAHGRNEIASANNEYVKNVIFGSARGMWTLIDELDVNDTLYFNSGHLITDDQELECFEFFSETSSPRSLELGNSIMRIVPSTKNMYLGSSMRINATNFTIDPGTSTVLAEHNTYMYFYHGGQIDFYRVIFQGHGGINISGPTTTIRNAHFHHDGDFRGEIQTDTLTFSPAKAYWMYMDSKITVDSMSAHGSCDGAIFISGYPKGITGTVEKNNGTLEVTNTMLEGIIGLGGASFLARASQDLGSNQGWTFMDAQSRTLYWVGGDGQWFDRAHWSLTSGGPGGECVPTAIDDVIFDAASFTNTFQSVDLTASNGPICRNLTWQNAQEFTGVHNGTINVTGSLHLQPNLSFHPWNTTFRSDSLNEIDAGNNELSWVEMMGPGQWTLTNELHIPYQFNLWQGTLITDDFDMQLGRLFMGSYPIDFARKLVLGNSHVIFGSRSTWNEQLYISSNNFTIEPGNSLVEFVDNYSGIRHYGSAELNLHNVYFSSIQGESRIEELEEARFKFNKLEFNNDGLILNNNEMDTLLLAAGKLYTLQNDKTQRVNKYLRAIGNNCTPIGLESTEPGLRSTIFSSNATVIGEFIQMRDQMATGGTRFSAGAQSTDISNNEGWIFEDDPDFVEIGFLGPDRSLCQDSMLAFSAFNFSPQEQYSWSTGATDSAIQVVNPGVYWVDVTFRDNCAIRDSVVVWSPQSIQVDLGADTTLCEDETLELQSGVAFPGATFTWQDQSVAPEYLVDQEGQYILSVEADGCQYTDSISIAYHPNPSVEIIGAEDACEGDTLVLSASVDSANVTFLWQDQSTNALLNVTRDGIYSVQVEMNNCFARDTAILNFAPLPIVDLGRDTSLCTEEILTLNVTGPGLEYLWQDGTRTSEYIVNESGIYWADVSLAHCTVRDSINVLFRPLPQLYNLRDTALCEGTDWQINLAEPGVSYLWNTGLQTGNLQIVEEGDYQVTAELNGCTNESAFNVQFEPPPTIDLGPNLVRCEGEEISFQLNEPQVQYTWQDGLQVTTNPLTNTGTYVATASKLNCARRDTIDVLFNPIPRFSLGSTQFLCPNDTFTIAPDQINGQLTWFDGSVAPSYEGNLPGTYWLEMEDNNCTFRDSVAIVHQEIPNINLGNDTIICHDQTLTLDARHSWVQSYQWQDGSSQPTLKVTRPGLYSVTVIDDLCTSTFAVDIQFQECQYFSVYLPNAFSPNGDGRNDTYLPFINPAVEVEYFLLQIYNRWGQLVYASEDTTSGWDGTLNGRPYTPDTFVVRIRVDYNDDAGRGSFEEHSTLTLVK